MIFLLDFATLNDAPLRTNGVQRTKPLDSSVLLRGPAAVHLYILTNAQNRSYANFIKHLKGALYCRIEMEKFYSAFDHRKLQPDEDTSLFLRDLEDLLSKAKKRLV